MKIDKSKLEALAALPDDELWIEAGKLAASYGFNLPKQTPSHEDMQKLRDLALGSKINMSDAVRLLNNYKKR